METFYHSLTFAKFHRKLTFFLFLIIFFETHSLFAQKKEIPADSSTRKTMKDPAKAALLSAIVPGTGQAFNKRFWKIPVIYSCFGGFTYLLLTNQNKYKEFKTAIENRYDDDPNSIDNFPQYNDQNLVTLKNLYRKRRDLSAAGIGLVYLLNVIDANVDAHLKQFDQKINESISLSIRPTFNYLPSSIYNPFSPGMKLKFTLLAGKTH